MADNFLLFRSACLPCLSVRPDRGHWLACRALWTLSYEGLFWAMLAWIIWGLVVDSLRHLWVTWCRPADSSAVFPYDE
jgi:hypothetical protein